MNELLLGKKTYTLAVVAILTAGLAYLGGGVELMDAVQLALVGGVAATLRHAITQAIGSPELADAVVDVVEDVVAKAAKKGGGIPTEPPGGGD